MIVETRRQGRVDTGIYWSYLSAGGSWFIVSLAFYVNVLTQLAISGADYWMSYWYVHSNDFSSCVE